MIKLGKTRLPVKYVKKINQIIYTVGAECANWNASYTFQYIRWITKKSILWVTQYILTRALIYTNKLNISNLWAVQKNP